MLEEYNLRTDDSVQEISLYIFEPGSNNYGIITVGVIRSTAEDVMDFEKRVSVLASLTSDQIMYASSGLNIYNVDGYPTISVAWPDELAITSYINGSEMLLKYYSTDEDSFRTKIPEVEAVIDSIRIMNVTQK